MVLNKTPGAICDREILLTMVAFDEGFSVKELIERLRQNGIIPIYGLERVISGINFFLNSPLINVGRKDKYYVTFKEY